MKYYHKHPFYAKTQVALMAILLGLCSVATAQDDYQWLVKSIDSNNTALSAYQKSGEAQKMRNRTGLTLPDPEVGASYLRLRPRLRNQRFDYNVSQRFEFPTIYGHRKRSADQQNALVDTDYGIFRANLVNEAINTYLLWVYYTQLGDVLRQQKEYAASIASSYQKAFEGGSVSVLERNKAQVNAVNAQKEFELNTVEINTLYQQLTRFNQGKAFSNLDAQFPDSRLGMATLQADGGHLMDTNKEIGILSQETALSETREKVTRAERLPEFNVGYMREQDIEVDFRGVTFGMTIPLWQKKNTVKAARLQTEALRQAEGDTREQYALYIIALQKRASDLHVIMDELENTISQTRGLELLKRALDLKEITILEYLVEQSMYFELTQKHLETRMNYHVALAELYKWTY